MRRWNGWGDDTIEYIVSPKAEALIVNQVGQGTRQQDMAFADLVTGVPQSRLPHHRLVSTDAPDRVKHARGQSVPDLIAMRTGHGLICPDGVAYPMNTEDVRDLLSLARETSIQLIPWGGGTSVVGHVNVATSSAPSLVIDMSRMCRFQHLDETSQLASFEAGISGTSLENCLRAAGYTLGHFPQSFEYSTLGGWIATRSKGQQSIYYGGIEKLFAGGNIETPLGKMELPASISSAAGPDLREIVLGSEGRLGIITTATMRISPLPQYESFHAVFFPDWDHGIAAVRAIAQARWPLSMIRLSDAAETLVSLALPRNQKAIDGIEWVLRQSGIGNSKCLLIVGATGTLFARSTLRHALDLARWHGGMQLFGAVIGNEWIKSRFRNPYLRNNLWEKGYAVDTIETATDWTHVMETKEKIASALKNGLQDIDEHVLSFTHLSHVYPTGSSIYTTYVFRIARDPAETLRRWQVLKAAASCAIVEMKATISHQHGVGIDHLPYLADEKHVLGIKAIKNLARNFDPDGIMNPGKLVE